MKLNFYFTMSLMSLILMIFFYAKAQAPAAVGYTPIPPNYDAAGRELTLPAGVPRVVDTNGRIVFIDSRFTTKLYRDEAYKLVMQEANEVAKALQLPQDLPVSESNVVEEFISPFGYAYKRKAIGNVSTKNYAYCVSVGNKFSYLEGTHQFEDCKKFQRWYTWPISRVNTNKAYQLATQWLAAASIDVKALNRDCQVTIDIDNSYIHSLPGKFVPIYYISWKRGKSDIGDVASVRLFTPTETLLQLRVEDSKYILRKPLVFTNLAALFPGTALVHVYHPASTIIAEPIPSN